MTRIMWVEFWEIRKGDYKGEERGMKYPIVSHSGGNSKESLCEPRM